MTPIIIVEIANGSVIGVQGVPEGYTFEVRDYDIQNSNPDEVMTDHEGLEYISFSY